MAHIQKDFEGGSIQAWELAHGIVRVIRGGCEYVVCADLDKFNAQCDAEKRERRGQMIAEAQAEAYFGGAASAE